MAAGLTAKQERFCVEYVSNGSKSYSDAYRIAFDCSRMKPASVNRRAFALKEEVKIRARIKELQDEAAERAMVTLAGHLEDLRRLRDEAREARPAPVRAKGEARPPKLTAEAEAPAADGL